MTSDIVYRLATVDDVVSLASLRAAFTFEDREEAPRRADDHADFERSFAEIVGDGIQSGRWAVWVAEREGRIVSHAFVGLVDKIPRPTREHRFVGYLTNVYTRPAERGRGIGSRLLEAVLAWAHDRDVELLVVWPSEESVAFYERVGFASGRDPLVWESS